MRWSAAMTFGVVCSGLFLAALAVLRLLGLTVGLTDALGAWIVGTGGAPAAMSVAGVVATFVVYALAALAYAALLARRARRGSVGRGALYGAAHGALAALLLAALHGGVAALPGWRALALVLLHVGYGALFAALYGRDARVRPGYAPPLRDEHAART